MSEDAPGQFVVNVSDGSIVDIVNAARTAIRNEEEKLEAERKARDRHAGKHIWRATVKVTSAAFFIMMIAGIAAAVAEDYGPNVGLGVTGFFGLILMGCLWVWFIE